VLYVFSLIDFPHRFPRCRFSCSGHRLCSGPDPTYSLWTVLLGSLFLESLVTSIQSTALSAANAESVLVLCLLVSMLVFSGAAIDLGLDFSRGGFGLRCLLLIYSPMVRFRLYFLLRDEAIGRARAFCPESQCRSPVFLWLYRFDLHLVLIFLFGLVSRCVGQEHVRSGFNFMLSFWFRSNCSVFRPRSAMSSCSRAGHVSSWIFCAEAVVPARCCFHQCIKSSTLDLVFSLLPLS
jgi:hypothetical protein